MKLEFEDIQGIIIKGYGRMDDARYMMLKIENPNQAKQWLGETIPIISNSNNLSEKNHYLNIAFTYDGLLKLGLDKKDSEAFVYEFQEGMCTPHRQRVLGDHGTSDPKLWRWGGPENEPIDAVLLFFGKNEWEASQLEEKYLQHLKDSGLKVIHTLGALTLPGRKEHFGFRDGISQPIVEGSGRTGPEDNTVAAGEFLFGYHNEYKQYPHTVEVSNESDPNNELAVSVENDAKKDFARNGSFLVFRQLVQDVEKFWKYVSSQTDNDYDKRIRLASKMVGRWPSGAPLVKHPDVDPKEDPNDRSSASNDDNFAYVHNGDEHGNKCPFGSHLRRTNPRDATDDVGPERSITVSKTHRIIRRGRAYGKWEIDPSSSDFDLTKTPKEEVGLQFLCFNTNIRRQFEFIQQTWSNNRKFHSLNNDPDPISGDPDPEGIGLLADFTIQKSPVRERYQGIPRFVDVKGGAYFFMPGIRALKYLANL